MKESIHLRKKHLKTSESLYLDIYFRGKRSYEYLNLYLVGDKQKDKQTLQLANAIKAKRLIELQNNAYGFARRLETTLVYDYAISKIEAIRNASSRCSYYAMLRALCNFIGEKSFKRLTFQEVTSDFANHFKQYLEKLPTLKQNTKAGYWDVFKAIIHNAIKDSIILDSPIKNIKGIAKEETERRFLTMEEIKTLFDYPIKDHYKDIKRAFLFSCLTGLRFSDVRNLTWGNVEDDLTLKQSRLIFRQQKTKNQEYLVINTQARELLGVRSLNSSEHCFNLFCHQVVNEVLSAWVNSAGIEKHITFHCARHTFAIMLLELDTDIYTVSKLLGHREIHTTQIYAKILDKKKIRAVERIPNFLKKVE